MVHIGDLNRRFGGLQVSPGLRLRFDVADDTTEAPTARDVDNAAPW
jgi:hypothetical protein